jgi:phosphomannomutase
MKEVLQSLRGKYIIGIVSGFDLCKITEQLGENILDEYDYIFSENGLVTYNRGQLIESRSISEHLGEDNINFFILFEILI